LYILQSETTGEFYIGSTTGLPRRLSEHNRRHSPYTGSRGPWQLVYHEEFDSLPDARNRERLIKTWKSHASIRQLMEGEVR
jgi:predicted GIY-YIG superfamily endonuclease